MNKFAVCSIHFVFVVDIRPTSKWEAVCSWQLLRSCEHASGNTGGDMQYMVTSAFFLHSFCGVFFCCFFVLAIVLWYYVGCHHCPAMACFEWPSLLLARLSSTGLIGGFVIFCACATLANMCDAHHCVMEKWHWKPASKQKGRDELWLCVTIQDDNGWQAECHHYMCIISP